jgi:hypothetical protein
MEAVPEAFGEAPAAGPPSQRAVPAPEPAPPAPLEDELEDEEVAPAARRPAATRRRALAGACSSGLDWSSAVATL